MDIAYLESLLTLHRYRSTKWWRTACSVSGLRAVELLELIGDEVDDPDEGSGIDVDSIIKRELGRDPDPSI